MVSAVNPSTTPLTGASTNPIGAATGQVSAREQTDRFMKLLVAQLNNQDPMNPMDNAQMTSQIAQINTVSGIQEVNASIKSMATQFSGLQMMQGASMIGRDVLTSGNTLAVSNGTGRGSFDLSANADSVRVEVRTPGGQLLDTLDLGAAKAGRMHFEWDASGYSGSATPVFKVSASQSGKAVSATPLARGTVESVSVEAGTMNLALKGGSSVAFDGVQAIL